MLLFCKNILEFKLVNFPMKYQKIKFSHSKTTFDTFSHFSLLKQMKRSKETLLDFIRANKQYLSLLFLFVFGFSSAYSQVCFTDSLMSRNGSDKKTFQGVFETASKWLPGQKITVVFLDGDDYVKSKVKFYAKKWEEVANVKFDFDEIKKTPWFFADIRISFKYEGSWSLVGKTSLDYVSDGKTSRRYSPSTDLNNQFSSASMNFGWFNKNTSEEDFRGTTLHEFGHALGLLHEHQNFNRAFEWNIPVTLNYFMTTQGWSRDDVYQNVINQYNNGTEYTNKSYDADSIMHYPIPGRLLKSGISVGGKTTLSAGDKSLIREMYPFDNVVESSNITFKNINVAYNYSYNGKIGMFLTIDYNIKTPYKDQAYLGAYFYKEDGTLVIDDYAGKLRGGNHLAEGMSFSAITTGDYKTTLFIPNDRYYLPCGNHKLKFLIGIFTGSSYKQVAVSGYTYFSWGKPCSDLPPIF